MKVVENVAKQFIFSRRIYFPKELKNIEMQMKMILKIWKNLAPIIGKKT